jgi:hypothetical protein
MRLIIYFLFLPVFAFGQFFYSAEKTVPESKYIVTKLTGQVNIGENIPLNSGDNSFTLAAWINLENQDCNNFAFGSDNFSVEILTAQDNRLKVKFNIKDSLVVEGNTHDEKVSDLIGVGAANTHIAVTFSGTNSASGLKIYINGDLIGDTDLTSQSISDFTADALKIGSSGCQFYYYNFAAYDTDLSAAQIAGLAESVSATVGTPNVRITGNESYKQSGFIYNAMKGYSNASGRLISNILIGGERDEDQTYIYESPFASYFFTPKVVKNLYDGNFYFAMTSRGGPGFERSSYIATYNPAIDRIDIISKIESETPLIRDQHQNPSIIITKDSAILVVREDRHLSPISYWKNKPPLPTNLTTPTGEIGSGQLLSYAHLAYLNDSLYMFVREGANADAVDQKLFKSEDDGDTWSEVGTISINNSNDWNYGTVGTKNDSVLFFNGFIREAAGTGYWKWNVFLQSRDGYNWCSIDSSLCKNIVSSSWTQAELLQYALVDSTTNINTSTFTGKNLVDTAGRVHLIGRNTDLGKSMHFWHAPGQTGWNVDTLDEFSSTDRSAPFYKGGDSFDVFAVEDRDGFASIIKYTTTDNFDTMDRGTIIYKSPFPANSNTNVEPVKTNLINEDVIFIVQFEVNQPTEQTGIFIYKYNPWE